MLDGINLKTEAVMLCDDIRTEDNGKRIIIGIYTGDIQVASLPSALFLRCFVIFKNEIALTGELNFMASLDGAEVTKISGEFQTDGKGYSEITFPISLDNIKEPSDLSVLYQLGDSDWQPLITRRILLRE